MNSAEYAIKKAELAARRKVILERLEKWLVHAESIELTEQPTTQRCCGTLENRNSSLEPDGGAVITLTLRDFGLPINEPKWSRVDCDKYELQKLPGDW